MADIPVIESTAETVVVASSNGQTVFAFDFLIFHPDQLRVFHKRDDLEIELSYPADFSVSGLEQPNGGSVSLSGVSILAGDTLTMRRDTPIERINDWQPEGDYKAALVNREQDTMFMIMQELARDAGETDADFRDLEGKAIVAPNGYSGGRSLPTPSPSRGIIWNADGTGFSNSTFSEAQLKAMSDAASASASSAAGSANAAGASAAAARGSEEAAAGSESASLAYKTQAELAALAAGSDIFTVEPPLGSAPSPYMLSTEAGMQVWTHDGSTRSMVGWLGKANFYTVLQLLSFPYDLGPVGTEVAAQGFSYEVLSPAAAEYDLITSGGVKLNVVTDGHVLNIRAFGVTANSGADVSDAVKRAAIAADRLSYKSTSASDGNTSHYRTPVELFFPRGRYRMSHVNIYGLNVSLRGDSAIFELSDQFGYIMLFAPWAGGWQGGYVIEGITFKGDVVKHLADEYGRVVNPLSVTATDLNNIAEHADMDILPGLENIGLIIGSNQVNIRNCSFTMLGVGLLHYSGTATIFGETGPCFSYSGNVDNVGYRYCLYGHVTFAIADYVGNLNIGNVYQSQVLKGGLVLTGPNNQHIRVQRFTADARGIPIYAENISKLEDLNSRFEPNSTAIGDTIDMSDLIAGASAVPYRHNGERISHYMKNAQAHISRAYSGSMLHAVEGSRVTVDDFYTQRSAAFYVDRTSVVEGSALVSGVNITTGKYSDPLNSARNLGMSKMPLQRTVSGSSTISYKASSLVETLDTDTPNYSFFNPFLSTIFPASGGSGVNFSLATDGQLSPTCLEVSNHTTQGWRPPSGPTGTSFVAGIDSDGWVVSMVELKRLTADVVTVAGPYRLVCSLDNRDEWERFISVAKISEGLGVDTGWRMGSGQTGHYRMRNYSVSVFPTLQQAKEFIDKNVLPVRLIDPAGSLPERTWKNRDTITGTLEWSSSSASRYLLPDNAAGGTTGRSICTEDCFIRAMWVKASGPSAQNVKVGSGASDDHYAASVETSASGWKKVLDNVPLDAAGSELQNTSVRITPLAGATMTLEYRVEFGRY